MKTQPFLSRRMLNVLLCGLTMIISELVLGQTTLISPTGDGGFETGAAFSDNNWTLVNGAQTNQWALGAAATGYSGNRAAYVSNDAGVTWAYTITATSVVHFYRDIAFPSGETDIQLTFDIQGMGEYSYDNLKIWMVATTTTPVAGTAVTGGTAIGLTYYSYLGNGFVRTGALIPGTNAGTTKRVVFSWVNNGSSGTQPPIAIDNIQLISAVPAQLSGSYTIDNTAPTSGTNFNNFVDAILRLNIDGISSGVTFNVAHDQIFKSLNPVITATGTISNPIIFQKSGSGANPIIKMAGSYTTTFSNNAGIAISGGDYFTFDGIDIQLNDASNTNFLYGYYLYNASATNGAQNNTIKNTKIILNRAKITSIGIFQNTIILPTNQSTGNNNNNKYYNITIENVYTGIYLYGYTSTYFDSGCEIGTISGGTTTIGAATSNDIGNGTASAYGIRATLQSGVKIFNSTIRNLVCTATTTNSTGIFLENSYGTSSIYGNIIGPVTNTYATASLTNYLVSGMRLNVATGASVNVFNNFIFGITGGQTTATASVPSSVVQAAGIVMGSTIGTSNIYDNSIRIENSANINSACILSTGTTANTMKFKDNILANFTPAQTGTPKHYGIMRQGTNGTISISDYNDYYIPYAGNGFVGYYTDDKATLADWQAALSQDSHSKDKNPIFASPSDLHSTSSDLNSAGVTISVANGDALDITTDIDGMTRNASTPDIGADEFEVFDQTSKVESPATQVSSGSIASTVTTAGAAVEVFRFKITDMGSGDGFATKVTNIRIQNANPVNGASWTANIAGVKLNDGSGDITIGTPSITASYIDIPVTTGNLNIADNTSKTITMSVYLKTTGIEDNKKLQFTIPATGHGFAADASGSLFAADFGAAITSNEQTITVAATKLVFSNVPANVFLNNNFSATVTAMDINGNTDVDAAPSVTIARNSGTGTLSSVTGLTQNLVNGTKTWTDLQYNTIETFKIQADDGILLQAVSDNIGCDLTVIVGTGASAQSYPFDVYYGYSRNAALYTQTEIGSFLRLYQLDWQVATAQTTNCPVKIYLKQTTATSLTADTWANMISGATLVYDGTLQFTPTGWFTIGFSPSFDYNANNLMVLTEGNYGGFGNSVYPTFNYTVATNMNASVRTDNTAPIGNLTVGNLRPNIKFTYTPPMDMNFISCSTMQNDTTVILPGRINQQVIGIQVVTSGLLNPLNVSSFTLSTNGTTSPGIDISNAKLWATGTSNVFATATQLGSTVTSPSGSFTINSGTNLPYTLESGTNYFWLTYDIPSGATLGHVLDAECTSLTVNIVRTPTITSPAGSRTILNQSIIGSSTTYPAGYPFNISSGYSRNAALYTQTEISSFINNLTSIYWQVASGKTTNCPVRIYLKKTTATVLSADTWANMISGATLVYEGTVQFTPAGWYKIVFSTSFNYDSDNLLVLTEANYGTTGTTSYPTFYYSTALSMNANQAANTTPPTGNLTVGSSRPNIKFITPAPKALLGITGNQASTNPVAPGFTNREILRIDLSVAGNTGTLNLNSLVVTSNNTNDADISSVNLFRTSSITFSTANQLGTTQTFSGGTAVFSSLNYDLPADATTYLWIAYDLSAGANINNLADAKITVNSMDVGGSTFPSTELDPAGSRTILARMSGTYNVGSGGDYSTLTGDNGLFYNINYLGLGGNVIANILSDITETGVYDLLQWSEGGAGNWTLTIQPDAATNRTISGSFAGGLIRLNGADRVTINGNYSGSGQYLTFEKSNTGTSNNTIALSNTANNNTIKNCKIYSKYRAIYTAYADNTLIEGNDIYGDVAGNTNYSQAGVYIYTGSTNTKIRKNSIHDFFYTGNGAWGCFGIYFYSSASTETEISNNVIHAIKGDGYSSIAYSPQGIYFASGGNCEVYNNSIYLSGNTLGQGTSAPGMSACIGIASIVTNLDIRNNLLQNSMGAYPGSTVANVSYLVYSAAANTAFADINYNDYYFTDQPNVTESLGYLGSAQADLAAWKTATGKDVNSLNTNPNFTSTNNLKPTTGNYLQGTYIASITTDFEGNLRSIPPNIGAYEEYKVGSWIGVSSTDWGTSSNWSFAVLPTISSDVVVNSSAPNQPHVTASPEAPAVCNNLTINSGASVTIDAAKALTVNGTLTNNAGVNGLVINSDATGTGSLLHNSGAVPATFNRFINNGATISTTAVTDIVLTSATGGGNIASDGGATVTARGVCWSTSPNPTTIDIHTTDGSGTGVFTSNLTNLTANTLYYVRAYATNSYGTAYGSQVQFTTQPVCGTSFTINHLAGTIAPVTKTVTYETATNVPGETTKCWITSNLGADHQATAVDDATEASAGWYWQFNRKQGFKNDGSTLTPSAAWLNSISENSDWLQANDPCYTELGSVWRIPTFSEWNHLISSGSWSNWTGPWNSVLKIHAAGFLTAGGVLIERGTFINYWSSTQQDNSMGTKLDAAATWCYVYQGIRGHGFSIRCLRDDTPPTVTTSAVSDIMPTSATCGGNVTSAGGTPVTARGVCWSTSSNPTIDDSHTSDGGGTGVFTSNLTSLAENTPYHVRAYATNSYGTVYGDQVTFTSLATCGSIVINHVAGTVAPVTKSITYGTVTNVPGETSKCWITSNLGSDHQATSVDDATEPSAGWYWQFNRKQGYQYTDSRTPSAWDPIYDHSTTSWEADKDPCTIELGSNWRIPTDTEWENVNNSGSWINWNGPWNSGLKMHAAGFLNKSDGSLSVRGVYGCYWSANQDSPVIGDGILLYFNNSGSYVGFDIGNKSYGYTLRCIRDL